MDGDTHATLLALEGDDERFDELLSRLVRDRHEATSAATDQWSGSDAAERAREARRELKRDVGAR